LPLQTPTARLWRARRTPTGIIPKGGEHATSLFFPWQAHCAVALRCVGDALGYCRRFRKSADIQDEVRAHPGFGYQSEQDIWIDVEVFDLEGTPAGNRVVEILEPPDEIGFRSRLIDKGATDNGGRFDRSVRVPSYLTQATVRGGVLGIQNQVILPLDGPKLGTSPGSSGEQKQ
jgi:hypothetical protein